MSTYILLSDKPRLQLLVSSARAHLTAYARAFGLGVQFVEVAHCRVSTICEQN